MPSSQHPFWLTSLTWPRVRAHLERDRRLLLPVGACEQYGTHLPLGAGTRIAEALADTLSQEFAVLRAPTLPYGINFASERPYAGTASLRAKTLHRVLNDLLAAWERHGFEEFILLTAQSYRPHAEAIATVAIDRGRLRVIDTLGINLAHLLDEPVHSQHAGEVETSLLLHLHPELVHLERAEDCPPPPPRPAWRGQPQMTRLPVASTGAVGHPSRASAELGERMYGYILQKIREKVFGAAPEA